MVRNAIPVEPRTSYRCAAWGCPNAGCINDEGEQRPGLCWQHFRESDRSKWGAITAQVKRDFATLKNHDGPAPVVEAEQAPTEAELFGDDVPGVPA